MSAAELVVDHPTPGARAGEAIAIGPGYRWVAYECDGTMAAAAYVRGRLLRRDIAGWWVAGARGERSAVADLDVAPLVGTVPAEWPVLAEQVPLLGDELLELAS